MNKEQFQKLVDTKTYRIAFIGMSNVGKTRISKSLNKWEQVTRVEVDEEIGKQLTLKSITSMAEWMGFPYEPQYQSAAAQYLDIENSETLAAIAKKDCPYLLDTTGSVIYLPKETLKKLRNDFLVVHIAIHPRDITELFQNFIAHPKPVVWGNHYEERAGETHEAAVRRCYPELLKGRLAQYNELADVSIPRFELYKAKSTKEIFDSIKKRLPA